MNRILVIEDNPDLAFGLRRNLELEGYDVCIASTGTEGVALARSQQPALIVLDIMLPKMDGHEVLEHIRREDTSTPILMLTARGEELDKVRGLRSGADDYVTKPFGVMELLARIEALLRRAGDRDRGENAAAIKIRDLEIYVRNREVRKRGIPIELSPKEFDLLLELLRRNGAVASRTELMQAVWGHSAAIVSRTVDTHIAELRRKLGGEPERSPLIVTVRKAGYRINTRTR